MSGVLIRIGKPGGGTSVHRDIIVGGRTRQFLRGQPTQEKANAKGEL